MRRILGLSSLCLVFGLAGCQSQIFEPVVPGVISVSNTTVKIGDLAAADVLFVVDDSGSMAGEQQNLADNFDVFIHALDAENTRRVEIEGKDPFRYRLAVASTSLGLRYEDGAGNLIELDRYGISDPAACQTDHALADGDPYPGGQFLAAPGREAVLDSANYQDDPQGLIDDFKANVRLGICGSGQEQGLLAMRRALEENPGFGGPRARLAVIFLSDEEDCSDPDRDLALSLTSDRCLEEAARPDGGLLGPVGDYAAYLRTRSDDVVVGSIVSATGAAPDLVPGTCRDLACEAACGYSDPTGSPCYCGGQSPGGRYLELAGLVGNGSIEDSICQTSFSGTLETLAKLITEVKVIWLKARPFEDNPALVLLEITRGGEEILCNSPTASIQDDPSQTCENDPTLDWAYDAEHGDSREPAILLCDRDRSQCAIQAGDTYRVSFVERACSGATPCR